MPGEEVWLEGDLWTPEPPDLGGGGDGGTGAVLLHPHPAYGGTMWNNVVSAIFDALKERGVPVLRFNFRGVGRSGGHHGGGLPEVNDALAAVSEFGRRVGCTCSWLVGYSFGAAVAAAAAGKTDHVGGFVAVAFPFGFLPTFAYAARVAKPKLFVQGTRDDVAPLREFKAQYASIPEPKQCALVEGADHFFSGHEERVAAEVVGFLADAPRTR
ncbi:MAG: alpha/beta hydrolase [Promethearchaeota archaeon]